MAMQRAAFIEGTPAPDFPGGIGEKEHVGRPTKDDVEKSLPLPALQTLGLEKLEVQERESAGARAAIESANRALGFE